MLLSKDNVICRIHALLVEDGSNLSASLMLVFSFINYYSSGGSGSTSMIEMQEESHYREIICQKLASLGEASPFVVMDNQQSRQTLQFIATSPSGQVLCGRQFAAEDAMALDDDATLFLQCRVRPSL
jgi:hypothetical protein